MLHRFLIVAAAVGLPLLGAVRVAHCQDPNLNVVNNFSAGIEGWQVYDYNGGINGGGNVFYPATWESAGGVGDSGYIWGDDSRWRIDPPEDPDSILSFIIYRDWVGGGTLDLREAQLSLYLRGDNLDLKGGQVYFWVLGQNKTTRWHLTSSPLEVASGGWGTQQTVLLSNNEDLWYRTWSFFPESPASLDQVLGSADGYGFSFLGFTEEVTGTFSMDELSITAVPEPAGLMLLGIAANVLSGRRRLSSPPSALPAHGDGGLKLKRMENVP